MANRVSVKDWLEPAELTAASFNNASYQTRAQAAYTPQNAYFQEAPVPQPTVRAQEPPQLLPPPQREQSFNSSNDNFAQTESAKLPPRNDGPINNVPPPRQGRTGPALDINFILDLLGKVQNENSALGTLLPLLQNGGIGNLLGSLFNKKPADNNVGKVININDYNRVK